MMSNFRHKNEKRILSSFIYFYLAEYNQMTRLVIIMIINHHTVKREARTANISRGRDIEAMEELLGFSVVVVVGSGY